MESFMTAVTDYLTSGVETMRRAENELRQLVGAAATNGDYEAVGVLTDWAKQMHNLVDPTGQSIFPGRSNGAAKPGQSKSYPQFYKNNLRLLMTGWSKKAQREYEHKVPKPEMEKLITVFLEKTAIEETVTVKALLETLNNDESDNYPDYYARTCLRWLLRLGLVIKNGHLGYSIKNRDTIREEIENNWNRLAKK
jgi:hypothetical protein